MRIDRVESATLSIPRKEPFAIARGSSTVAENVVVRVRAGDHVGYGNAAPNDVTHESGSTVVAALRSLSQALEGFHFERPRQVADRMDKILPGHPSAKAAIDIAVHDLAAQAAGMPLYAYLGGHTDRMATDRTIGIMGTDQAVDRGSRWIREGFRSLKVKVGLEWRADLERVRAIREAVGPTIELRVDGNQGFAPADALTFAREAQDLGIVFFEQPVSASDWEGMRALAESSPIPIMADEMVLTAEDAKKVRWANAANSVNLKLMKHGGIARAIDVSTICESAGFPTMVGCMGEPQISIAAALHFAVAQKSVRWLDLDSHFNLTTDPSRGLRFESGDLILPNRPGLGIEVDFPDLA